MEAFSDGVIAILITVMVLELQAPNGTHWHDLSRESAVLFTYVLSFVYLAIYWNNHHHMLKATRRVNGLVLWANMHLLFWLSLVPFTTSWMGRHHFATTPTACYGIVLLAAALAYFALQSAIVADQREDPVLRTAIGRDLKGKSSPVLYAAGIGLCYVDRWLGVALYVLVALMWLVPDRRVASVIRATEGGAGA
jgi:uncharacterized membrane protein